MIIRSQKSEVRQIQNTEHRRQKSDSLFSVLCLLCLLFLSSCIPAKEGLYKETRSSMYTIVSITVSSDSKEKAKIAIERAFNELDRLAKLLNFYSQDSEVSMINRHAGSKPVKVSPETLEIIEKALYVSESTGGAFDITVGPVVRLWDFKNKILPDKRLLKEKLKYVGYKNVILDKERSTVFIKKKGAEIDLGGIIKGYAADKASEVLRKSGIKSGIVAVGGDIRTFGNRPDGKPWKVGIQNPRQKGKDDEIFAVVDLSDMAISTSGDYERFFVKDGKWYHHLLNPQTGYPVYESQSVTVIAKEAVFTDAFATGIFVLGPQKGMDILKRLGFDGVIIDKNSNILVTEGIKNKIKYINGVLK